MQLYFFASSSLSEEKQYDCIDEEVALCTFGKGIVDACQSGARDKRIKKAEKAKKEGKDVVAVSTGWTGASV